MACMLYSPTEFVSRSVFIIHNILQLSDGCMYSAWNINYCLSIGLHDNVIKWKHFPRYCPFVRGIYQWPVDSPRKGQRRGPLMFCLICAWTNDWVNNRDAGEMRRNRVHYDVTVPKWRFVMLTVRYIEWYSASIDSSFATTFSVPQLALHMTELMAVVTKVFVIDNKSL